MLLEKQKYIMRTKETCYDYDTKEWYEDTFTYLMTRYELIKAIDMMDCSSVTRYKIFEIVSTDGQEIDDRLDVELRPLYYKGWQPNCLIQIVDEDDNVVIEATGTDH